MTSALGKRKEREEESTTEKAHGSTLFVSNLPYSATSVDLQTLFSDFAPVRSAFVVLEHGTGVSKGVGYVSFAVKEDAQSAYDTIAKDGVSLANRSLRVEWAENKQLDKSKSPSKEVQKEPKSRPPPRPHRPKVVQDPLAIRTIVISGLPSSIDSKTLWKKVRKYNQAEKVDWPVKSASGDDTAHVLFKTPSAASEAVNKLHAHVFKGSLLSVTLKKRLDTLLKPSINAPTVPEVNVKKAAGPSHASRLIVRNLPFNATEQDLRAAFLPYGPIHSIHIPMMEKEEGEGSSRPKPQRTKGFAFVWMLSKNDAQKAIEGCNGITIRAGSAEILAADKQKKKKQRREEKKMKAGATKQEGDDVDHEGKEDIAEEKVGYERVIAVDWALSKDKWQEEKAKMDAEGEDVEMDADSGSDETDGGVSSDSGEGSGEEGEEESNEELGSSIHEEAEDDASNDSENDDEDEEEPVKPSLPPPETGTTLFVRNLPFNATEDELRTLFRAFGSLRYARITLDHSTGRSRGTGFACFWNKEDADKVVAQSDLLREETTGVTAPIKKNPFTLPSILTPDPSSISAQSLVLHGRTLDVVRAVTRDEAEKLREAGEKAREKADKRNMYLLREGVILPNSPAAATLSTADIERRTASFNARRTLLKSNPSLYISKTRLSIRQIPTFVTERMLKRLAIHALRQFKAEVKSGTRSALTADEIARSMLPQEMETVENKDNINRKKDKKSSNRGIKQAKIVRQTERIDAITGKSRSKGYGFLELYTHADALRVLRWSNNNPDVGTLFEEWWKAELEFLVKQEFSKEPKDDGRLSRLKEALEKGDSKKSKGTLIVEFSIENVQVVKRRNAAQVNAQAPQNETKDDNDKQERAPKKRRISQEKSEAAVETRKPKNNIGSLIGRKRRERRTQ